MATRSLSGETPLVCTVDEAARKFACSRATVLRAIQAGRLRAVRVGKRVFRIPASEIDRILAG
jgi:excisionase family DNA binding protein